MKQGEKDKALKSFEKSISLNELDEETVSLKRLAESLSENELKDIKILTLLPEDEIGKGFATSIVQQLAEH